MPHDGHEALDAQLGPGEAARFWRVPEGDTEVLLARFHQHRFAPHTHARYVFGVITRGVETFQSGGEQHYATVGSLALVPPGAVHDGHAAVAEGWAYRMLYLDPALMLQVAEGLGHRPSDGLPYFAATVLHDPALAHQCAALFPALAEHDALAREVPLLSVLAALIQRHGHKPRRQAAPLRVGDMALHRAAERLRDDPVPPVTLAMLAAETGLGPFQLIRAFRATYGLPPHAFQKLARLHRAEAGLRRGEPIATVAADCGFADQAHLTRAFKRFRGITPGQFRAIKNSLPAEPEGSAQGLGRKA